MGTRPSGILDKVNEISTDKIHQTTLSAHMKLLIKCGIVTSRKEGKFIYYDLVPNAFVVMQNFFQSLASASYEKRRKKPKELTLGVNAADYINKRHT